MVLRSTGYLGVVWDSTTASAKILYPEDPKELADAVTLAILPFALAQMVLQQLASVWMEEELSPPDTPEGHPCKNPETASAKFFRVGGPMLLTWLLCGAAAFMLRIKVATPDTMATMVAAH
jgi:hypothetical protein